MHEILTIQLGHAANYLGAHYWNAQQSYFTFGEDAEPSPIDHDIHFRAGKGPTGSETYTPRVVIYDLKGGFGSLKKINALYEVEGSDDPSNTLWDRGVQPIKEPTIEQSPYTKSLETGEEPTRPTTESVRYWNDFNSVFFHPRSIVQCYDYELQSTIRPFESYSHGKDLFESAHKEHDILDRDFRFFAEETDLLQGIQLFTSVDDGWGGFASEYMEVLRDEFPKAQIWTWAIERNEKAIARERRIPRMLNIAYALSGIIPLCSIYVPLWSPPGKYPSWISINEASQWHTSALLSAAVETSTIPARFKDKRQGCQLSDLANILNLGGMTNISLLSLSSLEFEDHEQRMLQAVDISWTGHEKQLFGSAEVYRSQQEPELPQPDQVELEKGSDAIFSRYHTALTYPQQPSYPEIFRIKQPSLALCSKLRTSDAVVDQLRLLKETATKYAELGDKETLKDEFSTFCEAYQNRWVSDTDSGEDD